MDSFMAQIGIALSVALPIIAIAVGRKIIDSGDAEYAVLKRENKMLREALTQILGPRISSKIIENRQ